MMLAEVKRQIFFGVVNSNKDLIIIKAAADLHPGPSGMRRSFLLPLPDTRSATERSVCSVLGSAFL